MKKLIMPAAIIVALFVVYLQVPAKTFSEISNLAIFKWESKSHDFGTIKHNVPVSHEFTFTNEGTIPLIITEVKASCGCTVADYTKDPIQPNAKGVVTAKYNAAKVGAFNKTVTVNANTEEGVVVLSLRGEVIGE